ncbi:hypothetical protein [Calidifontibacillus erzurumensis]|uniref:Uncharacterized protein n=1 Tax=Calidifontibacillus erzurumensis TaxID=2741433 RepID=A0A8J8GBS8_9BACI|nr:hypothetical protein [Calidifontibacillus erzurumensis]NSL51030.1 hypothetical protein [Calidifontibacillus erzurumensis]
MKKIFYSLLAIGIMIGISGCNNNMDEGEKTSEETVSQNENENVQETSEQTEHKLPDLESEKTVDMMIEGTTEKKVVKLHHHTELGFSTYVPDDMVVESNPEVFNVFTNYGGNKNEDATLKITRQSEEELTKILTDQGFQLEEQDMKAFDFSEKEFSLQKEGFIGRIAFFKHADENYALYYYYPEEFADGFGPRSDIIVKEIVWHDEQ